MIMSLALYCESNHASDYIIPQIGTAGVKALSISQERNFGDYFMRKARGQGMLGYDPVLNEYINGVGKKLVMHAPNVQFPFEFFLSSDPSLNASAFLGGKVQVNAGLFHYTNTEDEFASVLAHEIAHVTQRHIARFIEENSVNSKVGIAGMIGAIALAVLNPAVGMAALTSTVGLMQQGNINYTRDNEYEADRIGVSTLSNAGYNPMAMSDLFRKLYNSQSKINSAYTMLIDHPLSEIRVAEAYNRAKLLPKKKSSTNPDFMLAKARVDVRYMNFNLNDLKNRLLSTPNINSYYKNYALSLIFYKEKDFAKAREYAAKIGLPGNDFVVDLLTDIDLESHNFNSAIARLKNIYGAKPYDSAIAVNLANAYIKSGQGENASSILKKYLDRNPTDVHANDLLIEAYKLRNDKCDAYQVSSHSAVLRGNYKLANMHLSEAMRYCRGNKNDVIRAKIAKIAELQAFDEKIDKKEF